MSPENSVGVEREITWGYQDLLLFAFLSFLSVVGCQLLIGVAARLLHVDSKSGLVIFPLQLLLYACLFATLFALIKLQYGRTFWVSLAWTDSQVGSGAAFLLGLFLAFAVGMAGALLHTPNLDTPIKHLLADRRTVLQFAILGTTVGPLCEELVFRGFIQPVLVRSLKPALGIIVTASLFGALHLQQNSFIWQSGLLITIAGLAFGWMRQVTHSTKASTWMHAGFNSLSFALLFVQNQKAPHIQ